MSRSLYSQLVQRYGPRADATTRREVLRRALAASAGLVMGGCAGSGGFFARKPAGKRVIVIGAGFAGLACAYELNQTGYDVNVFEARRRVGGRVFSMGDFVPGQVVEAGGELIGANHPTWLAYARQFKLDLVDAGAAWAPDGAVVIDGKRLEERQVRQLKEEMDASYRRLMEDAHKVNAEEPWASEDAAALDSRVMSTWVASLDASPTCKRAITADLEAQAGVAAARQSYLGKLAQIKAGGFEKYWSESWLYRCRGGNQELAVRLARSLGMVRLKLGVPVVAIHDTSGVVYVATADGKTYEADDVVLAISPGAWRRIQIYPELSAVLRVQGGSAVKFLAAMKSSFAKAKGGFSDGAISRAWGGTSSGEMAVVGYSAGPAAEAICRYGAELRDGACIAELQRLYPEFGKHVRASRLIDWPADPWTLGGICFPGAGDLTTTGAVLRKGQGHVHFAGEHCCWKFPGSMEGALSSGVVLARRLAVRDRVIDA